MKIFQATVLMVAYLGNALAYYDYSPCYYPNSGYFGQPVDCDDKPALQVLEAFKRNRDNMGVAAINFYSLHDMTDDILAQILDIISQASNETLTDIVLLGLPRLEKIPEGLERFQRLKTFEFNNNDGLKTIKSGAFSSSLIYLNLGSNYNLETIEPGAFQGYFDLTIIELTQTGLKKFDEAVFKPLYSGYTGPRIVAIQTQIPCDCDLAWLIRDNPEALINIEATCVDEYNIDVEFDAVDLEIFQGCNTTLPL